MTPTETSNCNGSAMASFAASGGSASRSKFKTIVADPPWPIARDWPVGRIPNGKVHDGRRTPIPYPTMKLEEIAALPIGELAERDAHLYVWTVNRFLGETIAIVKAWGFRYTQTLVWAKTPMGIGPGGTFAGNVEFIVLAKRGSLKPIRRVETMWWNWPRTGKHSAKPEVFQDIVESVSPGPYLELFARRNRLGWATWGNEALCHVELVTPNAPAHRLEASKT